MSRLASFFLQQQRAWKSCSFSKMHMRPGSLAESESRKKRRQECLRAGTRLPVKAINFLFSFSFVLGGLEPKQQTPAHSRRVLWLWFFVIILIFLRFTTGWARSNTLVRTRIHVPVTRSHSLYSLFEAKYNKTTNRGRKEGTEGCSRGVELLMYPFLVPFALVVGNPNL